MKKGEGKLSRRKGKERVSERGIGQEERMEVKKTGRGGCSLV